MKGIEVLVIYDIHSHCALKERLRSTHPSTHPYIHPCSLHWDVTDPRIAWLSSRETWGCSVVRWDVHAPGFLPKGLFPVWQGKMAPRGESPESIVIKRPRHHCLLTPSNLTALTQEPPGISGLSSPLRAWARPLVRSICQLCRKAKRQSAVCAKQTVLLIVNWACCL